VKGRLPETGHYYSGVANSWYNTRMN